MDQPLRRYTRETLAFGGMKAVSLFSGCGGSDAGVINAKVWLSRWCVLPVCTSKPPWQQDTRRQLLFEANIHIVAIDINEWATLGPWMGHGWATERFGCHSSDGEIPLNRPTSRHLNQLDISK